MDKLKALGYKKGPAKGSKPPHKSYLPKDENGKVKAGPGRGKGTPNRTTAEVKAVLSWAFDEMTDKDGHTGRDRFLAWCNANPTIFYTQMYVKMLPMQIQGHMDVNHNVGDEARQKLQSAFVALVEANAATVQRPSITIDGRTDRKPVPQLVVSSPSGTAPTGNEPNDRPAMAELDIPGRTRRGEDKKRG